MILEVRKVWQFFRDRRPESYGILTHQSGKGGAAGTRDTFSWASFENCGDIRRERAEPS